MKKLPVILLLLISSNIQAQTVFDYDYIIIPERFDFQESKHQFQLNSLLRVLFQKEGFTVLMNTEKKPTELANNPCLALTTQVDKLSSFLNSQFQIKLYDCYNNLIFESKIGESTSKKHKDGFKEGIRDAFTSIQNLERKESNKTDKSKTDKTKKVKVESVTVTNYKKDGVVYRLIELDEGYKIKDGNTKIAEIRTQPDGSLKYVSENINGVARFTPEGDLIVTYEDDELGRRLQMTYYQVQE